MIPHCTPLKNTRACRTTVHLRMVLATGLALCLLTNPGDALAKRPKTGKAGTSETERKKGASKITYQRSSSEETTAERDRRLYRECQGRHNAGACLGYTRK